MRVAGGKIAATTSQANKESGLEKNPASVQYPEAGFFIFPLSLLSAGRQEGEGWDEGLIMKRKNWIPAFAGMTMELLGLLSSVFCPAFAKSADDRVQALEDKWAQHEATKVEQNARVAEAISQIDRMRSEIQGLQGTHEAQTMQMKQLQEGTERHYRDLEMRIGALDSQLKLFQDQLGRALATVSPKLAQEGKDFQRGLDLVQRAEYQQALEAFQQFLKQYPKSPQKDEAQFWIAECRYGTKDFTQAIKDYQKFVELYPKSVHAPQAVLKQGDGFLNLQMKNEATVFYKKLIQDYPRSHEATIAKGKLSALEQTGQAPTAPSPSPAKPEPKEPADF